jgi:hypothetical protein
MNELKIIITIMTLIISTSCNSGKLVIKNYTENTYNNEEQKVYHEYKQYKNNSFQFSVEYPNNWKMNENNGYAGNEVYEGSPDIGISIYVENNETDEIYIYRQCGKIAFDFQSLQKYDFMFNNGTKGILSVEETKDRIFIQLILEDEFHGVVIDVSKECL